MGPRAARRPTLAESPGVSGGRGPLGAGTGCALLLPCALLSSQSAATRRAERGLQRPTRKPAKHKRRDTAPGYSAEKVKLETRAAWFPVLCTLLFHPHFPRPTMWGSFHSLSVASLTGALWKLRPTRGRRLGGASATAAPSRPSPRSVRAWRARRLGHLRPADFALLLELLHVCKHTPTKMDGTLNFARAPLCRGWAGGRASVPQSGVWLCFSRNALPTLIFRTLAPTSP